MLRSKAATRVSTPVDAMSKSVRTMYIQMEYVEKLTLKEAIEDGVTEADSWRLIVSAHLLHCSYPG
jgi:translation initiation factor 2-alpha kinase 4